MLDLGKEINSFFAYLTEQSIEIYNEFSLQHELGIYLRSALIGYNIQFERNVSFFINNTETIKKEIDITVFNKDKTDKYAIELKCPLNGQHPEQMYSFAKDIKFMEQLKERGFIKTYCVTLVSDKPFYQGKVNTGIYKYFREEFAVYGNIYKPTGTGKNSEFIPISGRYEFVWQELNEISRYYIIEI